MQKHNEDLTATNVLLGKTEQEQVRKLMSLLHMSQSAVVRLAINTMAQIHDVDETEETPNA